MRGRVGARGLCSDCSLVLFLARPSSSPLPPHTHSYGPRLLQLAVHLIALAPDAFSHSELCTLLRAVNTAQRSTAAPFSETELASLRGCFAERLAMAAAV